MKAIQKFNDEYLRSCRGMAPDQILQFLDDFRRLHESSPVASKLISIKVPENLLRAFRTKAALAQTPYQTKIKALMQDWILEDR
jgi:predicted DNA binding CopG/RHH family protein